MKIKKAVVTHQGRHFILHFKRNNISIKYAKKSDIGVRHKVCQFKVMQKPMRNATIGDRTVARITDWFMAITAVRLPIQSWVNLCFSAFMHGEFKRGSTEASMDGSSS
jgi:hypothetical protein